MRLPSLPCHIQFMFDLPEMCVTNWIFASMCLDQFAGFVNGASKCQWFANTLKFFKNNSTIWIMHIWITDFSCLVFRSSVFQMPSSHYLVGQSIEDKLNAIQTIIWITDLNSHRQNCSTHTPTHTHSPTLTLTQHTPDQSWFYII